MTMIKQDRINIVDVIKDQISDRNETDLLAITRTKEDFITYSSLFEQVEIHKKALIKIGFSGHDRIALFCEDSIEYVIMALAILDAGAVIVPFSPSLSSHDLESLCKRLKVKYIVSEEKFEKYKISGTFLNKLYVHELYNETGKTIVYSKEYLEVDHPAFIRFSSGTTGDSKGVLLTHQAIIDRTAAANQILNISSTDTIGWFLSMSFHFVVSILLFLRKGAHIVLSQDNFPTGIIDSFGVCKPTFLYASPFHYSILATTISKDLLSDVRMAIVTAVSLNKKTDEDFHQKFGIHLSQAYGIIEVGLPFINDRYDDEHICSVGKCLPGYDLKIKDPNKNGQGQILLKGDGMYHAYISPWKPRTQWFDTGDIGYLKENYLFISGRSKNVINFAGMKIFPEEVEAVILRVDNIQEVRVFAEEHTVYGQLPVAEVVTTTKEKLDIYKLKKYCMQQLDSYKIPKEFIQVESIEKTLSKKIKRT